MILFLSSSFLRRLRIQWKPSLKAFLVGDRNLFFLYPDSIVEVSDITPAAIDAFLAHHENESLELLGFLTSEKLSFFPGYAELNTGDVYDPGRWAANLHWFGEQGEERRKLDIKLSTES